MNYLYHTFHYTYTIVVLALDFSSLPTLTRQKDMLDLVCQVDIYSEDCGRLINLTNTGSRVEIKRALQLVYRP